MDGKGRNIAQVRAEARYEICIWCKQRFEDPAEREVHVSLLGAPGAFHRACFAEYRERSTLAT